MHSHARSLVRHVALVSLWLLSGIVAAAADRPKRPGHLHAFQRPADHRHRGSPHAGGHPHDLVQGRLGRRDTRQVGARALPRTPDVQGHRKASDQRVFQQGDRDRWPGERRHLVRLHELLSACTEGPARDHDGVRGRPHDRPDAEGRQRAARARRRARRVQHAGRQQSGRQAVRADDGGAVSEPSLRPAVDRLARRDREAESRGRARVLQALLRAEQRRRRGCRRCRAR